MTWVGDGAAPAGEVPRLGGARHESRRLAAALAAGDERAARQLRDFYAGQAPIWAAWVATQPDYVLPLAVALRHLGRVRVAVEVGAGSGQASALLLSHADRVIVTDLSHEMLVLGDRSVPAAVADVRRLPLRDASVDLIAGLNAVLAGTEVARVVRPDGAVVWASSFGPDTPLYVAPEELVDRLGPGWAGLAGRAGHGDWCVARRTP